MGRAPCCEKVGLKKGRWTAEEDKILTDYIQENGEGSWKCLPKNAGTYYTYTIPLYFPYHVIGTKSLRDFVDIAMFNLGRKAGLTVMFLFKYFFK